MEQAVESVMKQKEHGCGQDISRKVILDIKVAWTQMSVEKNVAEDKLKVIG